MSGRAGFALLCSLVAGCADAVEVGSDADYERVLQRMELYRVAEMLRGEWLSCDQEGRSTLTLEESLKDPGDPLGGQFSFVSSCIPCMVFPDRVPPAIRALTEGRSGSYRVVGFKPGSETDLQGVLLIAGFFYLDFYFSPPNLLSVALLGTGESRLMRAEAQPSCPQ